MELTKEQWLALGGGAIAVLKKHGADTAQLLSDVPKAISLAKDIMALASTVHPTPQAVVTPVVPPATPPPGVTLPTQPDLFSPEKVSAETVIAHIQARGISVAEKAIMDRASQASN
jgi:hypothetical protein